MSVFALGDLRIPIVAAPMAGGASTTALVREVGKAGGLGFVAAGYLTPQAMSERIEQVRASGDAPFGVNVFVPQPAPDLAAVLRYRAELASEAERYGVQLPEPDPTDDDHWAGKIAVLTQRPVRVVSFTFGAPPADVVEALRGVGTYTIATVTSVSEADAAAGRGVDALCVQGPDAGGHRGTFDPLAEPDGTPLPELLAAISARVALPLLAAGGLAHGAGIAAALQAGASAVQLGTAYLRTHESGANACYQAALADPRFTGTVVTRAFSGRPARALRNRFVDEHDGAAPAGYPAIDQLTKPLRAAAADRADPDGLSLWAGTGYRQATTEPAAGLTVRLWESARAAPSVSAAGDDREEH